MADIMDLHSSNGPWPTPVVRYGHLALHHRNRRHSSRNHFIRQVAKRYKEDKSINLCRDLRCQCTTLTHGTPHCLRCGSQSDRPQIEKALREELAATSVNTVRSTRGRRVCRSLDQWGSDAVEGRDLAHSTFPLPSDHFRVGRPPSLEREDAFRDASTAKTNSRLRTSQAVGDDVEVAELYRMGLLYDDEQERGSGFDLNSIQHEQPVYSVRPTKRLRKSKKSHSFSLDEPLYLDLSFTDLGGDEALAQFLSSPAAVFESSDDGVLQQTSGPSSESFPPLRVIYEVDGSQPSFDVDTSQPPELEPSLLSEYDYFSDSDLDDLPPQREVRDSAATLASDAWVVLGDDS